MSSIEIILKLRGEEVVKTATDIPSTDIDDFQVIDEAMYVFSEAIKQYKEKS